MKLAKLTLLTMLLAAGASVHADGGGSFTIRDKEFALKSAYAYSSPDPFDPSRQSTVVVFSGRAFDAKQIAAADNPSRALSQALDAYFPDKEARPSKVQITLARANAEPPIQEISYSIPDQSSGASGNAAKYTLVFKRNDDQRIEGTLRSNDQADKNSRFGGYFDLHFALDVQPDSGC